MASGRAIKRRDGKAAKINGRATTCKAKCCGDGGGGPGPGDCSDPDDCFYELTACRGVKDGFRWFISRRNFQNSIDASGAVAGACMWSGIAECYYISYPPTVQAIPRADVEAAVRAGNGGTVVVVVPDPNRTCCDCAPGCRRVPPLGSPPAANGRCCCNGYCMRISWTIYRRSYRRSLADPLDYVDQVVEGSGTFMFCGDTGQIPPQFATQRTTVGPHVPFPITDEDQRLSMEFPMGTMVPEGAASCVYSPGAINARRIGDSGLADPSVLPPATLDCFNYTWTSGDRREEFDSADTHIINEYRATYRAQMLPGPGDCGGGCFDALGRLLLQPLAMALWPTLAKLASAAWALPSDKGLGDTIARVLGPEISGAFERWFRKRYGRDCDCLSRLVRWNALYRNTARE